MIKDDEEVKIYAGKIREAAKECPEAEKVLKKIFGEVFGESRKIGDIVKYCGNIEMAKGKLAIVISGKDSYDCWTYEFFDSEKELQSAFIGLINENGKFQGKWSNEKEFELVLRPSGLKIFKEGKK